MNVYWSTDEGHDYFQTEDEIRANCINYHWPFEIHIKQHSKIECTEQEWEQYLAATTAWEDAKKVLFDKIRWE